MVKSKKLLSMVLAGAMILGNTVPGGISTVKAAGSDGTRVIEENLLQSFNTDFEGADGSGNLYWWNDSSWTGVPQKAYGDDEKATEASGNAYMEVNGKAQICSGDIAMEPKGFYEFSFYAKAVDGSGTVDLQVTSINSDWSSQVAADVTYDADVVLDESWQYISGTITMPAHDAQSQVMVAFQGSEGLTYGIDDFKIGEAEPEAVLGDNLVKNPNFAEGSSNWEAGKGAAKVSVATAGDAVVDGITSYGVISDRTSNADCFAQDMTGVIESGKTYEYSFWVMLDGDDYKDAPDAMREVAFAPYVVAGGSSTYWGSYSTGVLDNNCIKQIPAGEWVQFAGTFKPSFEGTADSLVIRIIEQGESGQWGAGDGVMGRYYLTGVEIREKAVPKKEIEWDIPNLKDYVSSADGIGTDAWTGVSLVHTELTDTALMDLVEKHFNAVTLGNELKMDAIFDYNDNNNSAPGFETITWTRANGTVMEDYKVPVMNFDRAKMMLDVIKAWNDEHPDSVIKVRGHVLTWHSQAPDWFFREDWDINKPYVSPEVMDARQEWYIKSVLEEILGPDSPYKDMFYGWDVVNEAVSDNSGTYRKDYENSSWWAVYQSNEFIINAFRYANKYAPASLELYYNDYNECMGNKVDGIVQLLKDVKAHENDSFLPTRIDGMGMQGHYDIASPTVNQIKDAAIRYGEIVGKVQLTELDLKASNDYDGTAATYDSEKTKQAYRYKEIYDVMREVDAMDGIDVNGITVWGVIDGNSWLQSSNSVGGASDGSKRLLPLLFDDDYKAKPAFWAFVDPNVLEPYIKSVVAMQALAGDDPYAKSKVYTIDGVDASFQMVWDADSLKVKVTVKDDTVDATDGVDLYIDWRNERAAQVKQSVARADAQAISGGYVAEFTVEKPMAVGNTFAFDIVVTDGDTKAPYNDLKMTQDESSQYYAVAIAKPYMTINYGTIVVDGIEDAAWDDADVVPLTIVSGTTNASVQAKLLWDEDYLYVWMDVKDSVLDKSASAAHEQDSVEVFIDENNGKTDSYEADDKQYRINFDNELSFNGSQCTEENMLSATALTSDGYIVEAAFKWTDIVPSVGDEIGLELQINDGENGARLGTVSWYDESGSGWSSPGVFGTALLVIKEELVDDPSEEPTEEPTEDPTTEPGTGSTDDGNNDKPSNDKPSNDNPKTGDNTPLGVMMALMMLSMAGAIVLKRKDLKK